MKIPAWLKILIVLGLLSIVFTILGAVSEFIIAPVLVLALILFPGRDPDRPTLVKVLPWLWGLSALMAALLLVAEFAGKSMFPAGSPQPTPEELWTTLLVSPVLIWALVTRHRHFRVIVIASTVFMVGMEIYGYLDSSRDLKAVIELTGNLFAELLIAGYLLAKVPGHKVELTHQ